MKKYPNYRIFTIDPWLKPYQEALGARMERLEGLRKHILGESRPSDFANGYMYFGLNRDEKGWVMREWLPGADQVHLIGDFNGWDRGSLPMTRLDGGVWEVRLDGLEVFPGQKYLLAVNRGYAYFDRVSAWARQVEQDPTSFQLSAVVPEEGFEWKHALKPKAAPDPLLIYEAHIGMAREEGGVGSYREFTENVLPRIKEDGYNTVQLMAVQSHAYYASFGYQVTNPFAPAHWYGKPGELKELVDTAHGLGLRVLLDVVHSHAADNTRDGIADMDGSGHCYCSGSHPAWGSRLYDYGRPEVAHYLLSNLKYWMDEFRFDGFRFDGVGSMLYYHHGLGKAYTSYDDYFDGSVDEAALCYLGMATDLIREVDPEAVTIAEEMSGYPGLCLPRAWGGVGMKYRLNMGVPDYWIKLVKDRKDQDWGMGDIWFELTRRRPMEKCIGYCESHDQALVGDKTLLFRMLDAEMYTGMDNAYHTPTLDRGIALIKLIKLVTISLAGDGYLNFMGNEFGHPEWIDFPREGNGWSTHYARRQWSLADNGFLKYQKLGAFDRDMLALMKKYKLPGKKDLRNLWIDEMGKLLVYEKGGLVFAFNFNPEYPIQGFTVPGAEKGPWKKIFSTDEPRYAGFHDESGAPAMDDLTINLYPRTAAVYSR